MSPFIRIRVRYTGLAFTKRKILRVSRKNSLNRNSASLRQAISLTHLGAREETGQLLPICPFDIREASKMKAPPIYRLSKKIEELTGRTNLLSEKQERQI